MKNRNCLISLLLALALCLSLCPAAFAADTENIAYLPRLDLVLDDCEDYDLSVVDNSDIQVSNVLRAFATVPLDKIDEAFGYVELLRDGPFQLKMTYCDDLDYKPGVLCIYAAFDYTGSADPGILPEGSVPVGGGDSVAVMIYPDEETGTADVNVACGLNFQFADEWWGKKPVEAKKNQEIKGYVSGPEYYEDYVDSLGNRYHVSFCIPIIDDIGPNGQEAYQALVNCDLIPIMDDTVAAMEDGLSISCDEISYTAYKNGPMISLVICIHYTGNDIVSYRTFNYSMDVDAVLTERLADYSHPLSSNWPLRAIKEFFTEQYGSMDTVMETPALKEAYDATVERISDPDYVLPVFLGANGQFFCIPLIDTPTGQYPYILHVPSVPDPIIQ